METLIGTDLEVNVEIEFKRAVERSMRMLQRFNGIPGAALGLLMDEDEARAVPLLVKVGYAVEGRGGYELTHQGKVRFSQNMAMGGWYNERAQKLVDGILYLTTCDAKGN